jgi:transcriptional regulator with AAA-type ATPase domain
MRLRITCQLEQKIGAGDRLCVFPIELPPLRDQLDDVPLLAEEFIRVFNREHGKVRASRATECSERSSASAIRAGSRCAKSPLLQ